MMSFCYPGCHSDNVCQIGCRFPYLNAAGDRPLTRRPCVSQHCQRTDASAPADQHADQKAGSGGNPDRRPRMHMDITVGRPRRVPCPVQHCGFGVIEFLLRQAQPVLYSLSRRGRFFAGLARRGLQQFFGIGDDCVEVRSKSFSRPFNFGGHVNPFCRPGCIPIEFPYWQ